MARKDDAQDAENAKDTTTSRASGKAASGTEPTTSKGTAPKSLDDLDMGTTGTESADSDSTTSTSKSAASRRRRQGGHLHLCGLQEDGRHRGGCDGRTR